MADITNEAVAPEKKESAEKSSGKSDAKSSNRSGNSRGSSRSGSNRSAASRSSSARNNSNRGGGRNNSGGNRNNSGGRGRAANSTANKVYKQSPIAITCYVLAALMLLYAFYVGGNTARQLNEAYLSMGQPVIVSEVIMYVSQAMMNQLIHAVTFFMAGYILTAVRRLDPKNYVSKKPAKKPAAVKEEKAAEFSKQTEKTRVKSAKAVDDAKKEAEESKPAVETKVSEEAKSAREEFEESLEAELKKEEEQA